MLCINPKKNSLYVCRVKYLFYICRVNSNIVEHEVN